jgi:adenylate kinase family enzyme
MSEFDSGFSGDSGPGISVEDFASVDSGGKEAFSPATDSTPVSAPAQGQGQSQQVPGTNQADNPAWAPFLEGVPEVFHAPLKKQLRSWDDNYRGLETKYQELEGKYKPYEAYQGVDPQALGYGLNLLQQIQSDPQKVYEALQRHLQQQGALQQEDPDEQGLDKDPYLVQLERQQNELLQRQQQMDEYVQQQQYNQKVDTYQQQIDSQVQALVDKFGPAVDVQDVLGRMFNQVNQGKQLDANAAFEEQKQVFQRMYQAQNQGRQAPNILPPSGSVAPTTEKPVGQMNEEERQAHLVQMLKFVNSGG